MIKDIHAGDGRRMLLRLLFLLALLWLPACPALAGTQDKPCPKCGDTEEGWTYTQTADDDHSHDVTCNNCNGIPDRETCEYDDVDDCRSRRTCRLCNADYGAGSHQWHFTGTSKGDGNHTRLCKFDASHVLNEKCSYTNTEVRQPSCTEGGWTRHMCQYCNHAYTDNEKPKLGHDWGEWTSKGDGTHKRQCKRKRIHKQTANCTYNDIVTPPTCTEGGNTLHSCKDCSYAFRDTPTSALGHAWGPWISNNDGSHTSFCQNDASHTQQDTCVYTAAVVAPTCTEAGYTLRTCGQCSHSYRDAPTQALGHLWGGPWVSNNNGTHSRACQRDASHIDLVSCAYTDRVVAPTCTQGGHTTRSCTVCGHSYVAAHTPAAGHMPGAWATVKAATRHQKGYEELRCIVCRQWLQGQETPLVSGMRNGHNACVGGTRLRDVAPHLTDKWYSYAALDLGQQGLVEYPLIASNQCRIGTVQVAIDDDALTVSYSFHISKYKLRDERLGFFASLEAITPRDVAKLSQDAYAFNTPIPLTALPQQDGQCLLLMRLLLNYDGFDEGILPIPQ